MPRVARLFKPYKWQVGLVMVAILLSSGLGVVNPLLTKVVFDKALFPSGGGRNLHLLYELVGLMIVIPLVAAAMGAPARL